MNERMENVDNMQEIILACLGPEEAYEAVCKALSYDVKEEVFSYICRCYDLLQGEEEE